MAANGTHLFQGSSHDLGSVVDGENNVCDTGCSEGLDLVDDHGLVSELDQRLRKGEGLAIVSTCCCCIVEWWRMRRER